MKSVYYGMTRSVEQKLSGRYLDLLSVSEVETADKETGEITKSIRFDVEVPRGYEALSRCQFPVKVVGGKLQVTNEMLEKEEFQIAFQNLTISYIDERKNVYFRAENYKIKKEEAKNV